MPSPSRRSVSTPPSELIAYIDGGSRGNPGPAGFGVVIQDAQGRTLETFSGFLGRATNNVAEYEALLAALEYASRQQSQSLKIYCDSELVTKQMQGLYRVQSPDLRPLHERARQLARHLSSFSIQHVPRAQNQLADRLANQAMDQQEASSGAPHLSFSAVVEGGKLKPVMPLSGLEEGAEYDVRAVRQRAKRGTA
ncbi:MAG: ribonuclease HI family protein [Acidobacteria bacterium]|nr:ribonuclease HI family protein [Acidobacteriota bacterium]